MDFKSILQEIPDKSKKQPVSFDSILRNMPYAASAEDPMVWICYLHAADAELSEEDKEDVKNIIRALAKNEQTVYGKYFTNDE